MRLLKFSFTAEHVKGVNLTEADTLSRSPVDIPTKEDQMAEQELTFYVNTIINKMPATSTKLQLIKEETNKDPILMAVKQII